MEPDSNQSLQNLNLKDFGASTTIATPSGEISINNIQKGDSVLAFTAKLESSKLELTSSEAKVTFKDSIQENAPALYIVYGNNEEFICSINQPFLLENGKYIQGGNLLPGQQLVDKNGNPVTIKQLAIGNYRGMINVISVGDMHFTSPDGHLLLANGIIVGDFIFEQYFVSLPDQLKA